MGFHNNRFIVVKKKKEGIYLARKIGNELHIDFIRNNTNIFNKYLILPCIVEEFDINIDPNDNLGITYINFDKDIILHKQHGNKVLSSQVIKNSRKRVYYLSYINYLNTDNIFYFESTEDNNKYKLYHKLIDDDIKENLVDDVETYEILNPFKVLKDGNNLLILYYYKNQICLKAYDIKVKEWSHSITLTDNRNKLYLDAIIIGKKLHLVYTDYDMENFSIIYQGYTLKDSFILRDNEVSITPKGNFTDPVIFMYDNNIWISFKSTNQLLSIYSIDNGNTWSDVYQWKETKKLDMVKYKYITDMKDDSVFIDYVYGCTGKDIRFMGFGDLKDTEVLIK